MGHEVPSAPALAEVHAWLAEDAKRRRDGAKSQPGLAIAPGETPTASEQAKRTLDTALDDLKTPERIWRGVTLLQGVIARWSATDAGKQARQRLKEISNDDKLLQRIEVQGSEDEIKSMSAQAKALERFGNLPKAIEAWEVLARNYEGTPVAVTAMENIKRLRTKGK